VRQPLPGLRVQDHAGHVGRANGRFTSAGQDEVVDRPRQDVVGASRAVGADRRAGDCIGCATGRACDWV
jgi:hypothetical protein